MGEIILRQNEDGTWSEKKEPFAVVECETEEDYELLKKAVAHFKNHGKYIIDERGVAHCNKCKHIDDDYGVHCFCPFCGARIVGYER